MRQIPSNRNDKPLSQPDQRLHNLVIILTVLATLIRLWGINEHSYWFDEAREVLRSLEQWPDVLFVTDGADPPVYRLLLFPIAQITINEFWLRLPSVLFSSVSVYLSYRWLSGLALPRLGFVTALLMAISSVQIYYAQEVSQYSLTVFLAVLLLIAFEKAGRRGHLRDWTTLTAVTVTAFYSYYGLAWLLPILDLHLAWRIWRQRNRKRVIGFVSFHILIGVSLIVLYYSMLGRHINRFTTNKQLEPLFVQPGLMQSLQNFDNHFLQGFAEFFTIPFNNSPVEWLPVCFAFLIIGGSIYLWLNSETEKYLAIYFWGTLVVMYLARFVGLYPLGGRYSLAILPLFFMLIAAVILSLRRWPPLSYGLALLFISIQIFFWPNLFVEINPWLELPREALRPAVAYLNEQAQMEDVVYVYYGAGPAYEVYQRDSPLPTVYGTWFRNKPLSEKIMEIHQAARLSPRFWLVMSHIHQMEDEELLSGLAEGSPAYTLVDAYEDQNAAVYLLEKVENGP